MSESVWTASYINEEGVDDWTAAYLDNCDDNDFRGLEMQGNSTSITEVNGCSGNQF